MNIFKDVFVEKNPLIFHDAGHAFGTERTGSALEGYAFIDELVYPSDVHQWLSPNDQRFHGRAKARWRSSKDYSTVELRSSLALLQAMNLELSDGQIIKVGDDFTQNFFLAHGRSITRDSVSARIREMTGKNVNIWAQSALAAGYLEKHSELRKQAEKCGLVANIGIDCVLDGRKWSSVPQRGAGRKPPTTKKK
jgi:hypothetical protein